MDIGTGPSLYSVVPATEYFENIILTDYSPSNREMQRKWLQCDRGAFDWGPVIKFVSSCDDKEYVRNQYNVLLFLFLYRDIYLILERYVKKYFALHVHHACNQKCSM